MTKKILISVCVIGMALLLACSTEKQTMNKYARKGNVSERDTAAFYFYEKGDYEKASFLLEDLLAIYRTDPRAEKVLYTYAYAKYKQRLYPIAAYHFEQYTLRFPNSDKVEECAYMIGYCFFKQTSPHYLDQTFTKKAIEQMQVFINTYPGSIKVEEANDVISKMREQLAHKAFEQAKLYLKLSNYKAAVYAFSNFIRTYPDSRYREEAAFRQIEAEVELAGASIASKKKNRYLDAIEMYERFVDRYPNSVYIREAETFYIKAKKNLGKILANQSPSS